MMKLTMTRQRSQLFYRRPRGIPSGLPREERKMIQNDEDLARLFGVVGTQTRMVKVRNEEQDIIDVVEEEVPLEERLGKPVFKYTDCGAWVKLENALPVGEKVRQEWVVHIRYQKGKYACLKAHMVSPEVGEWVKTKDWSADLVSAVAFEDGLDDDYSIIDMFLIEHLDSIEWDEKGECSDYFEVAFDTYVGGYAAGVTFGSIVEGVDQCATPVSVTFPCEEEAVWKALAQVEQEVKDIWNETHGCKSCFDGQGSFEEWMDAEYRRVDPECGTCHGQGAVI